MKDVVVLLLEDGHASTAIGPLEVFREAGVAWGKLTGTPSKPRFRVRSASIGGRAVRANAPVTLRPDTAIESITEADLVFVPSGGIDLDASLTRNRKIIDFVGRMRSHGSKIAAVCSGVGLVAASGMLDGHEATTHWALAPLYRERFPAALWRTEAMVTDSDGIYCGAGVHAALDLALYVTERLEGRSTAIECGRSLLIEMPRTSQEGFALHPLARRHDDPLIRNAEKRLEQRLAYELQVGALARELGMSPRNFTRRFKHATGRSPSDYLQRLRVERAKLLLETGVMNVREVSASVGYEDTAFFRDLFKRLTALTPTDYRRRFGPSPDRSIR